MASEDAIQLATSCWCKPETENCNMDVKVGLAVAEKFDELLKLLEEAAEVIGQDAGIGSLGAAWEDKYEQWKKQNLK